MIRATSQLTFKAGFRLSALLLGLAACGDEAPLAPNAPHRSDPATRPLAGPYGGCVLTPSSYTALDLGLIPGGSGYSGALGINDQGDIVGDAIDASGHRVPFVRLAGGSMTALPLPMGATEGVASDINNRGVIAGYTYDVFSPEATIWSSGSPRYAKRLGTLGGSGSRAYALNEAAQVVGWARTSAGAVHAFIWDVARSNTLQDLGALGGYESEAHDINEAGVATGLFRINGWSSAFLWTYPSGFRRGQLLGGMSDLGSGEGWGINNSQFIAGRNANLDAAVRDPQGTWRTFGYGTADDINDLGWAVASVGGKGYVIPNPGRPIELPVPPGSSAEVFAINACQQVVGNIRTKGETHATLWEPLPGA